MGCYAVAAMLEEPPSVACRHLVESSAHRLYERLAGTRPGRQPKSRYASRTLWRGFLLEGGFSEVRIAPVRSREYWTGAERLRTLRDYAPRRSSDPMALQEVLFPYLD